MTTWSRTERAALCDLLAEVGPDAPTLSGDWRTRDLVAHLLLRERRIDASGGIVLPFLRPWTERVQQGYAERPWPDLLATLRSGPPPWSPYALPKVESAANLTEFFVHHEDVRRAQEGWQPRDLHPKLDEALWKVVRLRGPAFFRRARVGVTLHRSAGAGGPTDDAVRVRSGEPGVELHGEAQELLLYAFGRGEHARVTVEGSNEALATFATTHLGV